MDLRELRARPGIFDLVVDKPGFRLEVRSTGAPAAPDAAVAPNAPLAAQARRA